MATIPLKHNVLNLEPDLIPQFTSYQHRYLEARTSVYFPRGTDTLSDRVENFQQRTKKLNATIEWNNNISLVRLIGTVILVVGGSLGLICGSLLVGIGLLAASFLLMSLGTLYLNRVDEQLSRQAEPERALGSALEQELDEASQFWDENGCILRSTLTTLWLNKSEKEQMIEQIQNGQRLEPSLRNQDIDDESQSLII